MHHLRKTNSWSCGVLHGIFPVDGVSHGGSIGCGTALFFGIPQIPTADHWELSGSLELTESCHSLYIYIYLPFKICLEASSTSLAIRYCRIDQSTPPGEKRDAIINEFNSKPSFSVMLLGMKCGGTGRVKFLGNTKIPCKLTRHFRLAKCLRYFSIIFSHFVTQSFTTCDPWIHGRKSDIWP